MSALEEAAVDSGSPHSPQRGRLNRHTPSQDSCCSNDTLFNLEDLTCILNEPEKEIPTKNTENPQTAPDIVNDCDGKEIAVTCSNQIDDPLHITISPTGGNKNTQNYTYITEFLDNERNFCFRLVPQSNIDYLTFLNKTEVPPLPSPEDKPWKQLPASLLNYNQVANINENFHTTVKNFKNSVLNESEFVSSTHNCVNVERFIVCDNTTCADYVNLENNKNFDYENTKNVFDENEDIYSIVNDDDIGVLGDIRFTGPGDGQLMSTSFSESNELGEEQGWDSGSDTRSSSSGEFIWKVSIMFIPNLLFT